MSSKRREIQKAELGIASPHSSLNLGCSHTVGGPFGTWLGPFRDLIGALSGLGWGPFGTWLGPFRDLVGVLSHGFVGVLSEAHRGKRKTTSEKCKASTACTLISSGWFRAHKKGARLAEMKHAKKVQGQQPWVLTKCRASQPNK